MVGCSVPDGSAAANGSDALFGTALLVPLADGDGPTDQVEVDWHLRPDFQGRGPATEATAALLPANGRTGCWH